MSAGIVDIAAYDPRGGPWRAALAICSTCLYAWAAVWPDGDALSCPECGGVRLATWAADGPGPTVFEAFREVREIRTSISAGA